MYECGPHQRVTLSVSHIWALCNQWQALLFLHLDPFILYRSPSFFLYFVAIWSTWRRSSWKSTTSETGSVLWQLTRPPTSSVTSRSTARTKRMRRLINDPILFVIFHHPSEISLFINHKYFKSYCSHVHLNTSFVHRHDWAWLSHSKTNVVLFFTFFFLFHHAWDWQFVSSVLVEVFYPKNWKNGLRLWTTTGILLHLLFLGGGRARCVYSHFSIVRTISGKEKILYYCNFTNFRCSFIFGNFGGQWLHRN